MTILITGATSKIAQYAIPPLIAEGHSVRAMVHSDAKIAVVERLGAEAVVANFASPASLKAAFSGAETLLLITPPHEDAADWGSNLISAALEASTPRVVRISALLAGPDGPTDSNRKHGRTDEELRRSGLAHVILRPHFFMQNLLADVDAIASKQSFTAAAGDAGLGMIDVRDIADVARNALVDARWDSGTYDLTGPASISFHDVARELSRQLRGTIAYNSISPQVQADEIRRMGYGEWTAAGFHDYLQAYSEGWGDFTTGAVEQIVGKPPRSFAAFTAEILVPAIRDAQSRLDANDVGAHAAA